MLKPSRSPSTNQILLALLVQRTFELLPSETGKTESQQRRLLEAHLRHRMLNAQLLLRTTKTAHLGNERQETAHRHVAVARRAFR